MMRNRARAVLTASLLMLTLAVAGCGSDGGSDNGGGSGDGVASANGGKQATGDESNPALSEDELHEKLLEYAQCLRDNGLDVQDPAPGEGVQVQVEGDPAKSDAAMKACEDVAPPPPSDADEAEERVDMLKFAKCMRDNGVEKFADPKRGEGIGIGPEVAEDPDFESAEKKCQEGTVEQNTSGGGQ